eukprot:Em0002g1373a
MAPISIGQLVHTYPVGTWNSSESAPKCFATHKNGPISIGQLCSGSARDVGSLVGTSTHLPCGYMEQLRDCPKVLCNSQEWHPSSLVSLEVLISCGHTPSVPNPRVTLGPWLAQVHTYLVGTWNSSESASMCFATHKNGTHLHWSASQSLPQSALQLTRMAPISIGQLVHTYPVGTWNSSESASKCFATHKNGTHLHCVLDPRVTLGPWLAQVHTYRVDTWNSSESAPKCFATHKNGTHLHCVLDPRVTLGPWLAQVHTYPVGTWNSSESAPKCFATHKNGTHLHCVLDPRVTLGPWLAQVQTYPVGTWNSSESAQSALQLTRMAPISIGQLVHTYLVGTWNSSESDSSVLDLRVTLGPWLAQVHTYPVGTWNSSESASKCFATHKNGTHLHWYTPTLWVHGTAQSLPQSALQLTRMAPISIGQLVHTYPVSTWNNSESAPKCFATHKNGTHLHWYTPTLWVHRTAQSLPQCALQLTRMAPISIGQLVHTYLVGTWNSSESAPKCFATHKNGTHLHCVLDPRVTLGPWLAQVHTYLVGTWNSSESASKCFATHKNGTHLHCVLDPRVTLGPWLAQVHTYPVGTWNSSESASKCFATHKNGTHLHCVLDPRVTLGPWLAQVHTYPVGTWNNSESAPKCFATHKNGTHLHCVLDPRVTLGPWLAQVHTYPVGTWNSSESASKCFATHKNGTHLHCVLDPRVTLGPWLAQVHTYPVGTGTAQSLPQSALQLTRMAPISIGQLVHTYPVGGYMEQLVRLCKAILLAGPVFRIRAWP